MRNLSIYFLLSILSFFYQQLNAQENLYKQYVSSSDLQVIDQGLFLYDADKGWTSVDSVFYDNAGLFVLKSKGKEEATDRCFNGHKVYCTSCWGCANPWCKGRCKCAEWPFVEINP